MSLCGSAGHSFLLLNSIPLYGYTTVCLPVDGHSCCFQFLALTKKLLQTFVDKFVCMLYVYFHFSWVNS